MNWKETLKKIENAKEWDIAIEFMQKVIVENPYDLDAYLFMNYLLMNLLVEEDYNVHKQEYYISLCKYYFKESYKKFSENPDYLFFTAITAFMSEWHFDIEYRQAEEMFRKALELEPNNILYQWNTYLSLNKKNKSEKDFAIYYCNIVLQNDSPIQKILKEKGSLGEYLLDLMMNECKETMLNNEHS